jgi:hypothetical protein
MTIVDGPWSLVPVPVLADGFLFWHRFFPFMKSLSERSSGVWWMMEERFVGVVCSVQVCRIV